MTLEPWSSLFRKYRSKGVLLDTNLLLLYLIGLFDPGLVRRFKPLANHQFEEADFRLVAEIVSRVGILITTPHVLAEVSSHAGKLKGAEHERGFVALALLIRSMKEQCLETAKIVETREFIHLGVTDAAICSLSRGRFLVLTTDLELYGTLKKNGADAINFTHLREFRWRS